MFLFQFYILYTVVFKVRLGLGARETIMFWLKINLKLFRRPLKDIQSHLQMLKQHLHIHFPISKSSHHMVNVSVFCGNAKCQHFVP